MSSFGYRKTIKLQFTNGLSFESGIEEILNPLSYDYNFIKSSDPDFIIFGPYGNDIPPKGNYVRIGYFCENMFPDMSSCDWAFGVPYEEDIKHPRYKRIQWHGFAPDSLVKKNTDLESVITQKTKFCNFIYSNCISWRERFCAELSKYKPVDAPGKSMNNMPSIDSTMLHISKWERKRKFLSEYKFTIAFENYSYPGYNTEKLLDPMVVNSLPIYWGNPFIEYHFNPKSFINAHEWLKTNYSPTVRFIESACNPDFQDMQPSVYTNLNSRIKRKLKGMGRKLKTQIQYGNFDDLIDRIIEIDRNDNLYAQYLSEPWFYNNTPPSNEAVVNRWKEIFG